MNEGMAINRYIGQQVRALRKSNRKSMLELGAVLGVGAQQIRKYEMGTNRLPASMLYRISEHFEVPLETFFPGPDPDEGPPVSIRALWEAMPDDVRTPLNAVVFRVSDLQHR